MELTLYGRACKRCETLYVPTRTNRCPNCQAISWYVAEWQETATSVEPVGIGDIADRLGVARQTAKTWQQRGLLPAPWWTVSGNPAWNWPTIYAWADASGRVH